MKSRFLHWLALIALVGSTIFAPFGTAFAATEWTCGSVTVTSLDLGTRKVTVQTQHSTAYNETIDLNWGDTAALTTIHTANTGPAVNSSESLSHTYAAGAGTGPFTIKMRVWASSPDGTNNDDGDDWHECSTTVVLNGCYGKATKLTTTSTVSSKTVTVTVSYLGNAVINWGDNTTTTLPAGPKTDLVVSHTYAAIGGHTIQLFALDPNGNTVGACSKYTGNTASDVTLSSMTAQATDSTINWTTIAIALLGVVVLGQLAVFAVARRK